MSEMLEQIGERTARLETSQKHQTELLEKLDHSINGNGQPGLKLTVAENAARIDKLEEERGERGKLFWMIAGTVICAVIGAFQSWLTHLR